MKNDFSGDDLHQVIDKAIVLRCACPAQVAEVLIALRDLHGYRESCLDEVLKIEGWGRDPMTIPPVLMESALKSVTNSPKSR